MIKAQDWARRPKPKVDAKAPVDIASAVEVPARVRLMIDLMQLALQTDSTRYITFALNGLNAVPVIPGVVSDWHNLSHHGQDPAKLAEAYVQGEVADVKAALEGARDIVAETMTENADLLGRLRDYMRQNATFRAKVVDGKQATGEKFSDYFDHFERWV